MAVTSLWQWPSTPSVRFSDHVERRGLEGNDTMRKVRPIGRGKQWPLRPAKCVGTEDWTMKNSDVLCHGMACCS